MSVEENVYTMQLQQSYVLMSFMQILSTIARNNMELKKFVNSAVIN